MKYSKMDREVAALICAIAASTPGLHQDYDGVCAETGIDIWGGPARNLAIAAWERCQYAQGNPDAEAEALIRSGWLP